MLTQDAKRLGLHPESTKEEKAAAKKRIAQRKVKLKQTQEVEK